jgi:hypothetical protein
MTEDQANEAIGDALQDLGPPEKLPTAYFECEQYATIEWEPTYAWRVGETIWAIEHSRGDRIPEATVKSMVALKTIDPNVQPAFFVPEREPIGHLLPVCHANGIALVTKMADHYGILEAAPAVQDLNVARIPGWVIQRLKTIQHLEPRFRSVIVYFCKRYEKLVLLGASDEEQERLLRNTFKSLLTANEHFAAEYTPLNLLRFFEQNNPRRTARDHYFHTFNNFLLGCIILDKCHDAFEEFRQSSLHGADCSNEYVWLLTVLFHDVGYPIQKRDETLEMIYGVPGIGAEQANAEKKQAWESPEYRISRAQLVSLYDHLSQPNINSGWSADVFGVQNHPLDKALERSFLEKGHGAASCMRMLAGFFRNVPNSAGQRQFLIRHIFLAGLSIPFHDWPVRKFLRELGILKLRTSRFPFASLLMFVDSIQEDRRGNAQAPDILSGIDVENNRVEAQIQLDLLSGEKLKEKKREIMDVKDFLQEDLLYFDYPHKLLS